MSGGWLVTQRPDPAARLRLVCVPYAGGGSSAVSGWAEHLPGDVEVSAVRLPGRESRLTQRPYARMADLLPALGEALAGCARGRTCCSATAWGARRVRVRPVGAGGRAAGAGAPGGLGPTGAASAAQPAADPRSAGRGVRRAAAGAGRHRRGPARRPRMMRLVMPGLRADFQLNDGYVYRPAPRLGCPVTALGGRADPHVDVAGWTAGRSTPPGRSPATCWRAATLPALLPAGAAAPARPGADADRGPGSRYRPDGGTVTGGP
ncbi:thioesterase domain-containing protein [Streptomyces sp. M19]